MMEQGYTLQCAEFYNWGNFQGWQTLNFTGEDNIPGSLFNTSPNALIAGLNGSGKSTLIDGIMVSLLPFEAAVHLGVTHDSEVGSGGGRSIRDYVLGKYSSTGDEQIDDNSQIYSRSSGTSIIVLVFQHNADSGRVLSIGRLWWYANRKIKEESVCFIAQEALSIANPNCGNLLDENGRPFTSARQFKSGMLARNDRVQTYIKVGAYFQALSSTFGDMSRDDLKLLNRAFYMKSVTHVDIFIRNYMLLENSTESIDRLIQHTEHAAEITRNIEFCEQKLVVIQRILKGLETYKNDYDEKSRLVLKNRLVLIYPQWRQWKETLLEIDRLKQNIEKCKASLPIAEAEVITQENELQRIQSLLAKHEASSQIRILELEKQSREEKKYRLEQDQENVRKLCVNLKLKMPKSHEDFTGFLASRDRKAEDTQKKWQGSDIKRTDYKIQLKDIEKEIKQKGEELQFLLERKTLIPKSIYGIKEACQQALKLPDEALMFVGELIAIKPDCEEYQQAVEAALNPISRNLLCLPEYLDQVTKWLNNTGLRATITIKRIKQQDLVAQMRPNYPDSSILNKIEVRSAGDNPFHDYLWNWLSTHFYHRIVPVKDFKKEVDKAVTLEGLVKNDHRTMRKFKRNIDYFLGWDVRDKQRLLTETLQRLNENQKQIDTEIESLDAILTLLQSQRVALSQLENISDEFITIAELVRNIKELSVQINALKEQSIDYNRLLTQEEECKKLLKIAREYEADLNSGIKQNTSNAEASGEKSQALEKEINHYFQNQTAAQEKTLEMLIGNIEASLTNLHTELEKQGMGSAEYGGQIQKNIGDLDHRMKTSRVRSEMHNYEQEYHDPDIHYQIGNEDQLGELISEWNAVREDVETTGLPQARKKWERFYNHTLLDAVKIAINDIRVEQETIKNNIYAINAVLKLNDFEKLPDERRYLQIEPQSALDERVKKFLADIKQVEKVVAGTIRSIDDAGVASREVIAILEPFVYSLQEDSYYRDYVTDVRNHYRFNVRSRRRADEGVDPIVETFTGAKKDAKSSAQTTQLAYALLASSLAYRFHFHDPVKGRNSLRLIILDEFGGKFDNEKPRDIVTMLQDMGFQSVLVSPMAKADLLAEYINQLILVYKASASESKCKSYAITSREDYEQIVQQSKAVLAQAN